MSSNLTILERIKDIVLNVDPNSIVNDARSAGMNVSEPSDFVQQAHNYAYIEKISDKYSATATKLCAVSGLTTGIGGLATTLTLAGADIANMAAQLYRLNQKLAIINGFDPANELHSERAQTIYITSLGIDVSAQAGIRALVTKAATENLAKRGPASAPAIRLVMEVTKVFGIKITKMQAGKLVPFIGGAIGAGVNYTVSKSIAQKMMADYKSDYFDRWQVQGKL